MATIVRASGQPLNQSGRAERPGSAGSLPPPRLIAWETTRACNLACRHCRAEAVPNPPPGELSFEEGCELLNQAAAWPPSPMIILSGGEPLLRPDIMELASYGHSLGLRMLMSTNGSLVEASTARQMKAAGVARVSLSLDGPEAESHDAFRGQEGSFTGLVRGAAHLRAAGLPFQINSTLTAANLHQAEALTREAERLGAVAHHIFLLVPVGRAVGMETPLSAEEYEQALKALVEREASLTLEFKATCAPQYQRLTRQLGRRSSGRHCSGRGCLAGQGFVFISSVGEVRGCGYLDEEAGNTRQAPLRTIYETSPLFISLRDRARYHGKCGHCEYWNICGGCRARARAEGNYLGPEPLCPHQPASQESGVAT